MLVRLLAPLLLLISLSAWGAPVETTITQNGQAHLQIVVSELASGKTRLNAAKLASLLVQITGTKFKVVAGDGTSGIVLGRAHEFPAVQTGLDLDRNKATRQEEYLIRTHEKGVWLLGATDLGAQNAMWDFLYRIGYRQYFPGEAWEVIPHQPALRASIDTVEKPSYLSRRIWYGYGIAPYAQEPYKEWCEKNRCALGLTVNSGHSYNRIAKDLKAEIDAHPEYLPLIDGERRTERNIKLELGNAELRKKIVDYAVETFRKDPSLESFSVDPSDGGGWSQSPESAKLGSVSDQVITLANEVAAEVEAKFPGKLIGTYAYNYHAPPPSIRVHPNVIVSVATAFIKGGYTVDELMAGWAAQGATLGVREYYSVMLWDHDLPGQARGGNLDYLQNTIPRFHGLGARYMSAEASDNWGPNGLGYWFATRVMWDIKEAGQKDALVEDFLDKAFGPAKAPMREFYEQLDGSTPKLVAEDQLGRMFRALEKAHSLTDDPTIRRRIDELTLYTRYASLFRTYVNSDKEDRQTAFEQVIRHAWRMRTTMLVHTQALYRAVGRRDKTIEIPKEALWQVPEGVNPWKSSQPFSVAEFKQYRDEGIAAHNLTELAFKPLTYSLDLIPAGRQLQAPEVAANTVFNAFSGRGKQTFFTHIQSAPTKIALKITGGYIAHYRNRGNVKVELFKIGGSSETGEIETLVVTDQSAPPDGQEHEVLLKVPEPGLYRVVVNDGKDRTQVVWPESIPLVLTSTPDDPINRFYRQWDGYFYVPKGTKVIGFFGGEHGELLDSDGRVVFFLNGRDNNYYSAEVPKGQDGKFWRARYIRGALHLLTVPPVFARTPKEILLPREVVEKDRSR
jgi:hypothetical protein